MKKGIITEYNEYCLFCGRPVEGDYMEDHKVRAEQREKGRKRKEAELIDMEKHPSPMSESFRRPAYAGTALCPDPTRRGKQLVSRPEKD